MLFLFLPAFQADCATALGKRCDLLHWVWYVTAIASYLQTSRFPHIPVSPCRSMLEQVSYLRVKKEKRGFNYNSAGDLGFNPLFWKIPGVGEAGNRSGRCNRRCGIGCQTQNIPCETLLYDGHRFVGLARNIFSASMYICKLLFLVEIFRESQATLHFPSKFDLIKLLPLLSKKVLEYLRWYSFRWHRSLWSCTVCVRPHKCMNENLRWGTDCDPFYLVSAQILKSVLPCQSHSELRACECELDGHRRDTVQIRLCSINEHLVCIHRGLASPNIGCLSLF